MNPEHAIADLRERVGRLEASAAERVKADAEVGNLVAEQLERLRRLHVEVVDLAENVCDRTDKLGLRSVVHDGSSTSMSGVSKVRRGADSNAGAAPVRGQA